MTLSYDLINFIFIFKSGQIPCTYCRPSYRSQMGLHSHLRVHSKQDLRRHRRHHRTRRATNRSDYCNVLMYGLRGYTISQLQQVLNSEAPFVTYSRRHDQITPTCEVSTGSRAFQQRINFNVLTMTYRALHGLAPMLL